jgi:hypothetical protein
LVIAQRSPPDLADRAYRLLENTATMVPWVIRSKRAQAVYMGILTHASSSESARRTKTRSFVKLIRGGQLRLDNTYGYTLILIFFAHHGTGLVDLATPGLFCPEARFFISEVIDATRQLTQPGLGVDMEVSQSNGSRHTADAQSQPPSTSERCELFSSVLQTVDKIIQASGAGFLWVLVVLLVR